MIRARLEAVFRLKAAGVVEAILELLLGPLEGDSLRVRFRGRRPPRYRDEEPEVIQIDGVCKLD